MRSDKEKNTRVEQFILYVTVMENFLIRLEENKPIEKIKLIGLFED